MITIEDFLGTWYLNGDKTKPCLITLDDNSHLTVSIGGMEYQEYSFNGNNEIYRAGYPTGTISSDLKRIDWTFVNAFWVR
jgi:hypothetical protein